MIKKWSLAVWPWTWKHKKVSPAKNPQSTNSLSPPSFIKNYYLKFYKRFLCYLKVQYLIITLIICSVAAVSLTLKRPANKTRKFLSKKIGTTAFSSIAPQSPILKSNPPTIASKVWDVTKTRNTSKTCLTPFMQSKVALLKIRLQKQI